MSQIRIWPCQDRYIRAVPIRALSPHRGAGGAAASAWKV